MSAPRDMNRIVGSHDLLWIVLDTLRYDVAARLAAEGRTPFLASLLPGGRWEERHTPGNFTFAAHQAFFAGFLPTPAAPGRHPRPFALAFQGSETTAPDTCVFDTPDLVRGFAGRGYHTACVGGVGFFNKQNPLGNVLPGYFAESHWSAETGVSDPRSAEHQVRVGAGIADRTPRDRRLLLFLNVAALHQPNWFYGAAGSPEGDAAARGEAAAAALASTPRERRPADTVETHAAALEYVDRSLPPLFEAFRRRGPTWCIVSSDHGTAYGEDGYHGHRLSHPVVWTVPYAEFELT